jgi:hypothetical protein
VQKSAKLVGANLGRMISSEIREAQLVASLQSQFPRWQTLLKKLSNGKKCTGGDVQTIVTSAEAAFRAQRNFIAMASTSKKPGDQVNSCIQLDTEFYHIIFVTD